MLCYIRVTYMLATRSTSVLARGTMKPTSADTEYTYTQNMTCSLYEQKKWTTKQWLAGLRSDVTYWVESQYDGRLGLSALLAKFAMHEDDMFTEQGQRGSTQQHWHHYSCYSQWRLLYNRTTSSLLRHHHNVPITMNLPNDVIKIHRHYVTMNWCQTSLYSSEFCCALFLLVKNMTLKSISQLVTLQHLAGCWDFDVCITLVFSCAVSRVVHFYSCVVVLQQMWD